MNHPFANSQSYSMSTLGYKQSESYTIEGATSKAIIGSLASRQSGRRIPERR